jgi:hypothetical protein
MVQLGRVAQGDNPAEERQLGHKAITVKKLCEFHYVKVGPIAGKRVQRDVLRAATYPPNHGSAGTGPALQQ